MDKTIIQSDDPNVMRVEDYGDDYKIIRAKSGKFLPGTRSPGTIDTTEKSLNLKAIRKQKAQETALQALNDVSLQANITIPNGIEGEYIGWYALNNHLSTMTFTSDNLRGMTESIKLLGHNTGMIEKTDDSHTGDITVSSDMQELIRNIADIVRGE